jgi:hypothetical protein
MRKPDSNRDRGNDSVFIVMSASLMILAALVLIYFAAR